MSPYEVKWIVDRYMFDYGFPKEVFEKLGIEYNEMEYIPFVEEYDPPFDAEDCVVTYGTVNAIRHLKQYFGTYLREANLNYNMYSANYNVDSSDFLNNDHFFVTYEFLRTNRDFIYKLIGRDAIFIRPNSGSKTFTALVVGRIDFDHEMNVFKQLHNLSPEELILVSSPKIITEEARFIICNDEAIAHSRYQIEGVFRVDTNTDGRLIDFVNKILFTHGWVPEEVFTLDVALVNEDRKEVPKIVELNSFSCAGWYDCDEETVIDKVSRFTYDMWKEAKQ